LSSLTDLNSKEFDLLKKKAAAEYGDPAEKEAAARSLTAA